MKQPLREVLQRVTERRVHRVWIVDQEERPESMRPIGVLALREIIAKFVAVAPHQHELEHASASSSSSGKQPAAASEHGHVHVHPERQ